MTKTASPTQQPTVKPAGTPLRRVDLKRILVPIDFSPGADEALEFAIDLAVKFGAGVTLLHVLELSQYSRYIAVYPGVVDLAVLEASSRKEVEARLTALAGQVESRGIRTRQLVRVGFSAPEIIHTAEEENSDCIVISTHGYSGLTRFLLGSTAERVVRHATCPVMVVRLKAPKG